MKGRGPSLDRRAVAITATVFVWTLALALRPRLDSDLFWHLTSGQWMRDGGAVLRADLYSFTRAGAAWVNHSWLIEVGMALLHRAGGFWLINLAFALVTALSFVLCLLAAGAPRWVGGAWAVLAAFVALPWMPVRPLVAGAFFLSLLVFWLKTRPDRAFWMAPAIVALWANCHGSFVLAAVPVAIYLAPRWARVLRAGDARSRRAVVLEALALAAAPLANPFGAKIYLVALDTVSIRFLRDQVIEWQSPDFHFWAGPYLVVFALVLFGALVRAGARSAVDYLLVAVFFAAMLLSRRNVPLFALMAVAAGARHVAAGAEAAGRRVMIVAGGGWRPGPSGALASAPVAALVGGIIFLAVALAASPRAVARSLTEGEPVEATRFLRSQGRPLRLFNAYRFGAYLLWQGHPQLRVFVDGRTDLYGDEVLDRYARIHKAREGWEALLAAAAVDAVVTERRSPLARALEHHPGWRRAHVDDIAAVFLPGAAGDPAGQP